MINKKDLLILSHLRQDGRQTLTRMSKKTQIPISTIYDKLKLHDGDLIKRHTCVIDFGKIGFSTKAFVLLRVDKSCKEELQEHLWKHMNVNSISKINNNYDFLVEVIFQNLKGIEEFLEKLDDRFKVKSKQVFYEVEDVKTEGFLAEPEMVDVLF